MEHRGGVSETDLIMSIFEPQIDSSDEWMFLAYEALVFYITDFARSLGENEERLSEIIRINAGGLMEVLERYVRDGWGVNRFLKNVEGIFKELDNESYVDIVRQQLDLIGIRVNTADPRKTRLAGVFSLWMSTLRPIYLDLNLSRLDNKVAQEFCSSFTFSLVCSYLDHYGELNWGNSPAAKNTRIKHVIHDFHCRQLALSPLELLYAGAFREREQNGSADKS